MSDSTELDVSTARTAGRRARASLSSPERAVRSDSIRRCLTRLPELTAVGRVAGYAALGDEVDLQALWESMTAKGIAVHLPRIHSEDPPELTFVRWKPGDALEQNRFGIGEPLGTGIDVAAVQAVVLPCVAVDDRGVRVGFGSGYYDRALAALGERSGVGSAQSGPCLIGVAFDVQRTEAIAARAWDVALDVVVTDQVVLRPKSRQSASSESRSE